MSSLFIRIALVGLYLASNSTGTLAQSETKALYRSWRKDVPEITWTNISPPFKGYNYFDHVPLIYTVHLWNHLFSPL